MKIESYACQVVLITGAASGFGELLARELAALGARLILADINLRQLDWVVAELRAIGGVAVARICDVRQEKEIAELVAFGVSEFGRIDVAINNAGICPSMKSFTDVKEGEIDHCFAVNTKGCFWA